MENSDKLVIEENNRKIVVSPVKGDPSLLSVSVDSIFVGYIKVGENGYLVKIGKTPEDIFEIVRKKMFGIDR